MIQERVYSDERIAALYWQGRSIHSLAAEVYKATETAVKQGWVSVALTRKEAHQMVEQAILQDIKKKAASSAG